MGAAFGASIAVSDLAIVPSGATVLDVRGAAETIKLVLRASGKTKPDVLVTPTRIDKRTSAGRGAVSTLAALTEAVSRVISYRAVVADELSSGESVATETPSRLRRGQLRAKRPEPAHPAHR
jgi:chromosome partitioning protein